MAVHRKTQKSLGSYDAKFLGPFTMRQSICLGIGLVPSALVGYAEFQSGLDIGFVFITVVLIMLIPLFLGFGEKITYGMKPEAFAKQYYIYRIQAPKIRKYKTVTFDDILWNQKKTTTESASGEKETKKKGSKVTSKNKFKIYEHKKSKEYEEYL